MKEDEDILSFFRTLDHMVERLDGLSRNYRPMLNGERFLSDRELSERLKISRRTLQEYRNEGRLPYIQLGGKVLYRESDLSENVAGWIQESPIAIVREVWNEVKMNGTEICEDGFCPLFYLVATIHYGTFSFFSWSYSFFHPLYRPH